MTLAQAQPALDLTRHHFKRDLGDFTLYGTWLYNEDQDDTEPCLVLLPRYRHESVKPCVIALSAAFRYDNPRYLAHMAGRFTRLLGFGESMPTAYRIANLIYDHLGDLVAMPPDPRYAIVVGEGIIRHADGAKTTIGLIDHEQIQQI